MPAKYGLAPQYGPDGTNYHLLQFQIAYVGGAVINFAYADGSVRGIQQTGDWNAWRAAPPAPRDGGGSHPCGTWRGRRAQRGVKYLTPPVSVPWGRPVTEAPDGRPVDLPLQPRETTLEKFLAVPIRPGDVAA